MQGTRPPQGKNTNTSAVSLHVYSAQCHLLATHKVVWTLLSHPYRTREQEVQVEEDAEEHDDEDDEDGEDNEDNEDNKEDKGDGGNHATVVVGINETNPQGERNFHEKDKAHEEGEDEDEGGGDDRDDEKKRRTPNTCLPQANQRSMRV